MDGIVEVAADTCRANARVFGLKVKHLAHHAGLPEQVSVKRGAVRGQAVPVVRDHSQAECSITGDVLAAGDGGRERPTIPFLEQVQREPGRTRGQVLPAKLPPHHFLEGHELVGIARERVKAPRDAVDAVDEQAEMDARPPRDRIPGHRLPVARRYQPREHAEERFLRNRRRAIHRYRASAAEDCRLRGEQTVADREPEQLLFGGEPREVFGDRRAGGSPRGLRNLVDHGPLDTVRGAQRVGPAVPLGADAAGRQRVQLRRRQRKTGCDQCQKLRLLTLCRPVVLTAAEPDETRDGAVADPVEEYQAPAKSRRRNAEACKCMPSIVLAISERALTVLPGFPPVHRREAHEEGTLRKKRTELGPRLRVEDCPPFESVLLGCIVVHGGRAAQPLDRR